MKFSVESLMLPQPHENQCRFEYFCVLLHGNHKNIQNGTGFRAVAAASNFQSKIQCCHSCSKTSIDLNNLDFYRSKNIKLRLRWVYVNRSPKFVFCAGNTKISKTALIFERLRQHQITKREFDAATTTRKPGAL